MLLFTNTILKQKAFVSLPQEYVKQIEEINGMPLTEEQKRRYKEGKKVTMPDGTSVQASPASKDFNSL